MTVHLFAAERRARGLPPARPDPMVAPGAMVRLPHGLVGTIAGRGNDGRLLVRSGDVVVPCARDDVTPLYPLARGERVRIEGGTYGTVEAQTSYGNWWWVTLDPVEDAPGPVVISLLHRALLTPLGKVGPLFGDDISDIAATIGRVDGCGDDDGGRAA